MLGVRKLVNKVVMENSRQRFRTNGFVWPEGARHQDWLTSSVLKWLWLWSAFDKLLSLGNRLRTIAQNLMLGIYETYEAPRLCLKPYPFVFIIWIEWDSFCDNPVWQSDVFTANNYTRNLLMQLLYKVYSFMCVYIYIYIYIYIYYVL
jgi:hypothetical protein